MKFSILIAHYNNYHYFINCYESILSQTYKNFEVIIVDDCSTDDSWDKIKKIVANDIRFKIYQNEKNRGVGYTKKRCVELAIGDICGFLDPDDAIVKNALEEVVIAYEKNINIIATYSLFYICDKTLKKIKIFPKTKKIKNGDKYFFNIGLEVAHFFTFKRKTYLETEGLLEKYRIAEDQDLYLKLYEKGDFYFINKPLLLYRFHEKGLSHKADNKMRDSMWHKVIKAALKRRKIEFLHGEKIEKIENFPRFLFIRENTFLNRVRKKIKQWIFL